MLLACHIRPHRNSSVVTIIKLIGWGQSDRYRRKRHDKEEIFIDARPTTVALSKQE
jgi:hypothetical protein